MITIQIPIIVFVALGASIIIVLIFLHSWVDKKVKVKSLIKGNYTNSFRRKIENAKKKDYIVISQAQLKSLLQPPELLNLSAQELLDLILAISEKNKLRDDPKIDDLKRDTKVYEDDYFSIYQVLPNEFVIYSKTIDTSLFFDVGASLAEITNEEGSVIDNIEDVIIRLNGDDIMIFNGQNLQ